jgi:tetratricopeptide (TPR) repeat protein
MTARYNGYFNAGEIIRTSLIEYRASYQENYFDVLPVTLYPAQADADALNSQMEAAIKKTSLVITKHSMPNPHKGTRDKREEWCRWIDENWLVMGKAYVLKHDYKEALEKLKYVKLNYPEEPSIYQADIWIAQTYIHKADFGNAFALLQKLEEIIKEQKDNRKSIIEENKEIIKERKKKKKSVKTITPLFPEDLQDDVIILFADIHLHKKEYTLAAERLEEAIKIAENRKEKARLHFVLAQVYQKLNNNTQASMNFDRAMKLSADYKLAFHARIFKALLYTGDDTRGLRAELRKLLKDDKNIEFRDQIYYALGELDMKDGNQPEAIQNFLRSAKATVNNDRQKTRTYYRLGNIHYDSEKFPQAKLFYDSCLTVAKDDFESLSLVKDRSEGLTDLVENFNNYNTNDSLLKLVRCGESCYLDKIDKLIEDFKEKERLKRNAQSSAPVVAAGRGGKGGWYFYNNEAIAFGVAEFRRMWGDRVNEDNWRRKDKSQFAVDESAQDSTVAVPAENDPYSREYYVKNLPLTDKQQDEALNKIATSLYNLGVIYRERFKDLQTAEKYFSEAYTRFQPDKKALAAAFQLYTLFKEKNSAATDEYKDFIINNFPDSDYAKIIQDPDYLKKKEEAKRIQEFEYNNTYALYQLEQYNDVIGLCNMRLAAKPENKFSPEYLLLKAYAMGMLPDKNNDSITVVLQECITRFPETDEGKMAKKLLDNIKKVKTGGDAVAGGSPYVFNADMEHFFVLIYPSDLGKINQVTRALSDFNRTSFNSKQYKTSTTFLNPEQQMVLVKSFANSTEALQYYNAFKSNTTHVKSYNQNLEFFVITHKNYNTLFLEKKTDAYSDFFKSNY